MVDLIAAGRHLDTNPLGHRGAGDGWFKTMARVVAMSISGEARLTEIKVITDLAMQELRLSVFYRICQIHEQAK
jgi:hypothetical protein